VAVSGDTSGVLQLATNGGTTAVTIDTSQNVGVGTTSPGTKFQVTNAALTGTTVGSNRVGIFSTSGTGKDVNITFSNLVDDNTSIGGLGGVLYFLKNSTETMRITSAGQLLVGATTSTYGAASGYMAGFKGTTSQTYISLARSGTNLDSDGLAIGIDTSSASIVVRENLPLYFFTNNANRMVIDSSGNLLVGRTDNPNSLTAPALYVTGVYTNTTGSAANVFVNSNGALVRSTSSLKYKTDVQDATHGLVDLLKLRSVTYKGKNTETDGQTIFGGLIAEEVDAAGLTEFVQYAEDGTPDALAYGNMVSLCVKAIQEQQALITTLQTQVAALTAKVGN
jgi:hypothetical protein